MNAYTVSRLALDAGVSVHIGVILFLMQEVTVSIKG